MAKGGTITGKQLITDEGINRPLELKKNLQTVIDKTEELIQVAQKFNQLSANYKGAKTEKEYLKIKKEDIALTKSAIQIEKEKNTAALQAQKIESEILRTKKLALEIERKKQLATRQSTKLTIEERVQNQANNKVKRLQARLQLGLVDAYEKLNTKRNQAQRRLANLLSAEKQNVKQIRVAQREYDKLNKRVKAVDTATDNFTKNIGNYKSAITGLTGVYRSLVSALGLVGGAMAFVNVMRNGIKIVREFGATMSNVAGIYRVSRKDLADLEDKIISVAGSSVKTATEVAKLAESLATLGKTKDEIAELLEPVNNLSIGLKATSDETAEFLVQTINSFGGSAEEAEKYADVIATIRTSTSLDFQKMRDSFQYLTPISKILNKDLAYTGALIGLLADNGVKAERAGRLLGTAQQKLAKEGKTLAGALEEVNDAAKKGVKEEQLLAIASELFGKQAASLGIILAQNTDKIEVNAQAIRDNGGALDDLVNEQLTSLDAHLLILKSRWEEYILNTDKSSGASNVLKNILKFLADNLATILDLIIKATGLFLLYKGAVIAVGLAKRAATAYTIAYRIAVVALNRGLVSSIKSMKLLRVALINTGIGAAVILVVALVVALKNMNRELSTSEKRERILNNARKTAAKSIAKEKSELDTLVKTAKNENLSKEQRLEAIKRLNEISPEYLGNITLENINTTDTTRAINAYIKALDKKALAQALLNKKTELYQKLIDTESSSIEDNVAWYETLGNAVLSGGQSYNLAALNIKTGVKNRKEAVDGIKEEIQILDSLIKKKSEAGEIDTTPKGDGTTPPKQTGGDNKKQSDEAKKRAKEQAELEKKLQRDAFELAKFRVEKQIKLNDELSKNEKANLLERLDALEKRTDAEEDFAKLKRDYNYAQIDTLQYATAEELKIIEKGGEEAFNKRIELAERAKNARLLVEKQYQDELKEIDEKNKKDSASLFAFDEDKFKKGIDAQLDALTIQGNEELTLLNEQLARKEITQEEHEKRVKDLKIKYSKEALEAQLKSIEALLAGENLSAELRQKYEKQVSDIKLQLSEISIESSNNETNKTLENLNTLKDAYDNYGTLIADLGNSIFDNRISKIDEELEKNEEYYNRQLELAGNDEAQKQLIQEEAEKKRQALEKKKRKEQRKQAILNKAMAALDIGINTGIAIVKAVAASPTTGGLPFSAIAAAVGALQLATVLAKPIPKYAKGTENHPGGFALVGEERPEVISEPNKAPYIVSNPSVLDLPTGTKVTPSLDEYNRLMRASILASVDIENNKLNHFQAKQSFDGNDVIVKEMQLTRKAIEKNKTKVIVHQTKPIDFEHELFRNNNENW